jgi:hypothetical protein
MSEQENASGAQVPCISLLAWIERQEAAVERDRLMFVQQRNYDLCRLMDGRSGCLWELRQWLKWEHGVEANNVIFN